MGGHSDYSCHEDGIGPAPNKYSLRGCAKRDPMTEAVAARMFAVNGADYDKCLEVAVAYGA